MPDPYKMISEANGFDQKSMDGIAQFKLVFYNNDPSCLIVLTSICPIDVSHCNQRHCGAWYHEFDATYCLPNYLRQPGSKI